MEPRKSVRRHSVHIEAIRLRARGLAVARARGIADGLGQAIAEAVSARALTRAGIATMRMPRMELGPVVADGRSSAALRSEIAAAIAASLAPRAGAKG